MEGEVAAAGRGRGRGRGRGSGQSILPAGLWESIRGDADDDDQQQHQTPPELPQQHYAPHNKEQFEDADYGHAKGRGRHNKRDDDEIRGKPVFKKGDWECPSCMNMNWSWRTHCNMCNTPKLGGNDPAGVRDGAGGGFNERQERAAIVTSTEVAEDGFDDFGRRSKANKSARERREEAALQRLQAAYGFLLDPATVGAPPTTNGAAADPGKKADGFGADASHRDAAKEFGFVKEKDNGKKDADRGKQSDKGRQGGGRQDRRRDRSDSRDRRGPNRRNDDDRKRRDSRDRDRRSRSRSQDRYRRDGSRERSYR